MGGVGGAIAYVIGMYCQFLLTIFYLEKMKVKIEYKKYLIISVIPFAIGYLLEFFNIGIIGGIILILISFIIFLKIKLIVREDINDVCKIFERSKESSQLSKRIINILEKSHLL